MVLFLFGGPHAVTFRFVCTWTRCYFGWQVWDQLFTHIILGGGTSHLQGNIYSPLSPVFNRNTYFTATFFHISAVTGCFTQCDITHWDTGHKVKPKCVWSDKRIEVQNPNPFADSIILKTQEKWVFKMQTFLCRFSSAPSHTRWRKDLWLFGGFGFLLVQVYSLIRASREV